MNKEFNIDKTKTAIVVIDLQKGIASRETQPYSAKEVIENTAKLLKAFRKNNMPDFFSKSCIFSGFKRQIKFNYRCYLDRRNRTNAS